MILIAPRHYAHGFIEAVLNAKRGRRAYDPEEAKAIAAKLAEAERRSDLMMHRSPI